MLQEQPVPAWGNHPPRYPILPLVGGDAATNMQEEPVSNPTPLLRQNLSLGKVILPQKMKDKQMLPHVKVLCPDCAYMAAFSGM